MNDRTDQSPDRLRVVVIGGGFGGLSATMALSRAKVDVTLVDRRNHHLFQPLLYQVATGGLSPANIAAPLRSLVKKQKNARVLLGEVDGFDLGARHVRLADGTELPYDRLVVASGAGQSYFGHDEWAERAPGLKSIDDATRVRRRVLLAFERAERERDPARVRELLTFVIVGAGPTGVEMAGAVTEVAGGTLPGEFRDVDPKVARVILVEGQDRVLPPFPEDLSASARESLEELGVEVRTGTFVDALEGETVTLKLAESGETENLVAGTVFWAAGVAASPLGAALAEQSDAETDRAGRVIVEADCSLAGRREVFVVGDLARFEHGVDEPLPGLAPVAMQQGRYVAKRIREQLVGVDRTLPFRYVDKGNMAVIGRRRAVADINGLHVSGTLAWLLWLFVHLLYLVEFENRVLVLMQWGWNYFTRDRNARLITGEILPADMLPGDVADEEAEAKKEAKKEAAE